MTLNRRIGLGFTLGVDPAGGTSFTLLGAIIDGFEEEDVVAEEGDITILTDTYKQTAKGQINPGGMSYIIAWDPDETSSTTIVTLLKATAATAPVPPNWQISYPAGTQGGGTVTSEAFTAHLMKAGRMFKKDKMVQCKVTIKKTGQPGFHGN